MARRHAGADSLGTRAECVAYEPALPESNPFSGGEARARDRCRRAAVQTFSTAPGRYGAEVSIAKRRNGSMVGRSPRICPGTTPPGLSRADWSGYAQIDQG